MKESDFTFDRVMQSVGDYGKFQKRFNFLYNFLLVIFCNIAFINLIMIMAIPDHWCHIPGRENTNYSIEQWKDIHLPKEPDSRGKITHSFCKMYNFTAINNEYVPNHTNIISCQFGYDYDKTWYISTVPTTEDWVCERELLGLNVLVATRFGKIIGSFIFGQLGDYIGRRPIYILSLTLTVFGKYLSLFTSHLYYIFMIASTLSLFPTMTATQSALVIATEITNSEKLGGIAEQANIAIGVGMVIMALVFWAIPDWTIFYAISNAPIIVFLCISGMMIESPRWLFCRGKTKKCIKELMKITKVNETTLDDELITSMGDSGIKPEVIYGVLSTMSSWRLARNTLIVTYNMAIGGVAYFVITMNSTNLEGNPFLNFLWQSVVELPAYVLGKVLCDRIGRRYSGAMAFFLSAAMFVPIIIFIRDDNMLSTINIFVFVGKFFMSMTFYVSSLQQMEIFPTCVRQSGLSFSSVTAGSMSLLVPYIIYLGTSVDARYPYAIMTMLSFVGAVLQLFVPETLFTRLPTTLKDAEEFGKDQSFFHFPKKSERIIKQEEISMIPRHEIKE